MSALVIQLGSGAAPPHIGFYSLHEVVGIFALRKHRIALLAELGRRLVAHVTEGRPWPIGEIGAAVALVDRGGRTHLVFLAMCSVLLSPVGCLHLVTVRRLWFRRGPENVAGLRLLLKLLGLNPLVRVALCYLALAMIHL